jgi:hypothetical protein
MNKKMFLVVMWLSFTELAFSATPQELLKGYEASFGKASPSHERIASSECHDSY